MFISIFWKIYRIWIRSLQLGIRSPEPGNPWCGWRAGRGRRCQLWPVMVFWRFFGGDDWSASTNHFCSYRKSLSNFSRLWWSTTSWEFWWFGIYNHPWTRMEQCMFEICMIPQGFYLNRRSKWGPLQLTGNACFRKPYLRRPAKTYNDWLLFQDFPGWRNVMMILVRVYYGMIWISLCMSLVLDRFGMS